MLNRLVIVLVSVLTTCSADTVVLTGATVIDVRDFGKSARDVPDAVVIIGDGMLKAIGTRAAVPIPRGSRVVDLSGKFVIPGLCESFIDVGNQRIVDALVYMGVTTALSWPYAADNGKPLYYEPTGGPLIIRTLMITGYSSDSRAPRQVRPEDKPLSDDTLAQMMEASVNAGVRGFHLAHSLQPRQTALVLQHAKALRAATIGELATTPYPDALNGGVNALLHSTRYALALADPAMQASVASDPFGPARAKFYDWLGRLDPASQSVSKFARALARSKVGLIPTLAMLQEEGTADHFPESDPVRRIVAGATGLDKRQHPVSKELASNLLRIERVFAHSGVRYLTGGGTHYRQLPGRSVHTEMKMLERIGLTRRQALAAATSNFGSLFRIQDVGELKPGARADLVVLDANPLIDIANTTKIHSVYIYGREVDRESLLRQPK